MRDRSLSILITKAVEDFLNDRKGYHIDCLPNDIREEFLDSLEKVINKVLIQP